MFFLPLLFACSSEPINLTEKLGTGEVRAGEILDSSALFGGISSEGQPGDFKLYNRLSRWIVQGVREGSFYISQGGYPIDVDITRPSEHLGQDIVDEWGGMFGLGRLLKAESIQVINDGLDGKAAVIRVTGSESPMELVTGALESDIVADKGLELSTEYRLEPESLFLEVTTRIKATQEDVELIVGDILMGSTDAADLWVPGVGLDFYSAEQWPWIGFAGRRNEVAIGVFAADSSTELDAGGGSELLLELAELAIAMNPKLELKRGESTSFTRLYGVGKDLATLTDAWQERVGHATKEVSGVVQAPDGPVAGARVNILVDDQPFTLAFTDAKGRFSARVPEESDVDFLADGRGPGVYVDLPSGHAPYSPYSAKEAHQKAIESLVKGSPGAPLAQERGIGTEEDPLSLAGVGRLTLSSGDGLPFSARLIPLDPRPPADKRLVMHRAAGWDLGAWARDGEVELPIQEGRYRLVVHRGLRWEVHEEEIEIQADDALSVQFDIQPGYELDEYLIGDPHAHASPSPDGSIPMTDRLIVTAGAGIQVHFGTDHDHAADYRPLIEPLELSDVLTSIVADEVSPVVRGHRNVYPIVPDPEAPNGGAWPWWSHRSETTDDNFKAMRAHHSGALVQLNHPTDNGIADSAGWSPGNIENPKKWTENFEAVEVLNSFKHDEYFSFYADLINRGLLVTPTGVSDSHGYYSGAPGFNVTFLHVGHSDPSKLTPYALKQAMLDRKTVVSSGPFIRTNPLPGSVIAGDTELSVEILTPSWMNIDTIQILQNGFLFDQIDDPVPGDIHRFVLSPNNDAWFTVIASGSDPMLPVHNRRPWAMTSALLVDVDGNGWTAPFPPLTPSP